MDLRRGNDRFVTRAPGVTTRHSFSFGAHYDPANTSFGTLVALNDDTVEPGAGYADHPHRDLEIVTWVLEGALTHRDSHGNGGVITPGVAQTMSAGDGVIHAETVEPGAGTTRFIQAWILPDEPGGPTVYTSTEVDISADWTPIASGTTGAATRIGSRRATLWVARLQPGQSVAMVDAAQAHAFVARGSVDIPQSGEDVVLADGDAVRGAPDEFPEVRAREASELLLWTFNS